MANNPNKLSVSNDIFRFASVRAINTHSSDALERRYITLSKDTDAENIKKNNPNVQFLFFNMNRLKDYPAERLKVLIDQEKKTSKFIIKPEEFAKEYSNNFDSVYEWHRTANKVDSKGLIEEINKALGHKNAKNDTPIKNFLANKSYQENKFRLYETLVAYYLNPEPAYFLDVINQRIRWFWIMQRISNPDNDFAPALPDDAQAIKEALHATIIMPFETDYPKLEIPADNEVPPTKEKENTDREFAHKRLADLNHAESEITEKHNIQIIDEKHAAKYCEDQDKKSNSANLRGVAKSTLLASRYVAGLSDKTHEVIDNYRIPKTDGLNTEHILDRINSERKIIVKRNFPRPNPPVVVEVNGRFIQMSEPCIPYKYDPCATYPQVPIQYHKRQMRTPGWADLKVIKSTLLKYEKGEIAHIENVLKGEKKVREFNVTKRTEESLFTEEELTSETEKETQSTDRFELEKEMSQQSKEDMKFDTGVKVSAKLGPVQLDTHLDFAYNTSKEESNKTATKNSQEMMNRALSKVIERKKTQRTVTTIITTEDKNSHTLDNTQPQNANPVDNIHGMYFWVDKYYLAKVVNYGSRFMLEFMVPEPAAFYLYSKTNKPQPVNAKVKPDFPQIQESDGTFRNIKSFEDITEENYADLAAKYNAAITIYPPQFKKLGKAFSSTTQSQGGDSEPKDITYVITDASLAIEDGYEAKWAVIRLDWDSEKQGKDSEKWIPKFKGFLGNIGFDGNDTAYPFIEGETGILPLSIHAHTKEYICNIEIGCEITSRKIDQWKLETYTAILAAYNKELTDYENWQTSQEVSSGISIQGNNTDINRQVEKEELKKHCIQLMTGQDFSAFNAVNNNVAPLGYPEINADKAFEEGKDIQFFEQAFEWEQMTYVFYPYFWGRKPNWVMIKSINDTDPIFTSFLQAGAARVLVPTRPGFEDSVVNFLAGLGTWNDPKIWTGTNPPIPSDKLWISIVDELKEKQGQFEGGEKEGEPWIYKIPTSLVYLESTTFKLEDTDLSKTNPPTYPNDLQQIEVAKTSADFS